ncbi:MAG: hypothetical protein FLDDKLPJ_01555 [Phycisphaerae bacterium]|nr:hypothetical protein [Phycisphaerae bacterium]
MSLPSSAHRGLGCAGIGSAVLALLAGGCAGTSKGVTTPSLLREMTDLRALAQYPDPPFTCKQFSSYDRASVRPDDAETWFANGDWGQFIREEKVGERTEYVMADMAGPGAIVRIWSANPKGTLRIYLDGNEKPEIECPMQDFLGGKLPWNPSPISGERSRGWNSYFPIPYAKHCKVTCDEKEFYYHVNYRTYPSNTPLKTIRVTELPTRESDTWPSYNYISSCADYLDSSYVWLIPGCGFGKRHFEAQLHPHGPPSIAWESTQSGAVNDFQITLGKPEDFAYARHVLLRIMFDGKETVLAPLTDFFGCGPTGTTYISLPSSVVGDDRRMRSDWVMPYKNRIQISFQNLGDKPVTLYCSLVDSYIEWTNDSMHFHAKTRIQRGVPTMPKIDWNYLTVTGQGVFVGAAFSIANPVREWWGEGDEKIYVDGEAFPSHFGTGTEDYFGYAWCCNVPFQHAYHNQPRCDGPYNYGHTTVNRWHILDKIPFEKSFRFDMELWHWNKETDVDLAVTAYWYAKPGATDGFPPLDPADLVVREIPPYVPPRTPGAIEGEEMTIVEKAGAAEPQNIWGTSNDAHLWWREGHKVGDKLVLSFTAPNAGAYEIIGRFVKAADYGVHQLHVNDAKAGEPIDFYNNGVIVSEEIRLGRFELRQGENQLAVEVVGANEKAVVKYMFGLDYVRLEAAREGDRQ